jgi:hypothetical protein
MRLPGAIMDQTRILPPGQHPRDPASADIDALGYALERLQTLLIWVDEHRSSFEKLRISDAASAANELACLKNSADQAVLHLHRLTELLLAGYAIDPNKRLPKSLCSEVWLRFAEICEQSTRPNISPPGPDGPKGATTC